MKYIPERYEDIIKLVHLLNRNEITAEEYFEACNEYAKILVDKDLQYPGFK